MATKKEMTEIGAPVFGITGRVPIVGIDPSLTSTGICKLTPDGRMRYGALKSSKKGIARLRALRDTIREHASEAALVVIEGYSFGSRGRATFSLGELGGVLRVMLAEIPVPVLVVPPQTLKKFITGKGNTNKTAVSLALMKRWGLEIEQEDEADAIGLALFGAYAEGADTPKLPTVNLEALSGAASLE